MTSDHGMASERYLNHPTFGIYGAPAGEAVTSTPRSMPSAVLPGYPQPRGAQFEVIPYGDARPTGVHLGRCRRDGSDELES